MLPKKSKNPNRPKTGRCDAPKKARTPTDVKIRMHQCLHKKKIHRQPPKTDIVILPTVSSSPQLSQSINIAKTEAPRPQKENSNKLNKAKKAATPTIQS